MHAVNTVMPAVLVGPFYRTGSTLVMELLSTCPEIAMTRHYPYEYCYLTYLLQMSGFIGRTVEADWWDATTVARSPQPESLRPFPFYQDRSQVMFEYLADEPSLQQVRDRSFTALWQVFSDFMKEKSGGLTRYYSEKMPDWAYAGIAPLLGARGIFTLRDPRDVYVSGLRWNAHQKRVEEYQKTAHIPEPVGVEVDPQETQEWAIGYKKRLRRLLLAESNETEFVVRYENLIRDPAHESHRLARWLGVEFELSGLKPEARALHATSDSPEASIGRWRRELPADLTDVLHYYLKEELLDFGYLD